MSKEGDKGEMRMLSSTLISKKRELFYDWCVTRQSIVIRSEGSILQARTWEGELIGKVDIAYVKKPNASNLVKKLRLVME